MESESGITDQIKETHEKFYNREVLIEENVLNALNEETKRRSLNNEGEFWVFLLGKAGIATEIVPVGISSCLGVTANPEEVVSTLSPYVNQDYSVVADYHNHPNSSVETYKNSGFLESAAVSPSIADVQADEYSVFGMIQSRLNQNPYPRIIAAYSQTEDKLILNAFHILRDVTNEDTQEICFEVQENDPQETDEFEITLTSSYVDPIKLDHAKIIQPINIGSVQSNGIKTDILNDFQSTIRQ